MSDPQHSSDVEDVLSSIRRLVSEEKRPQSEPAPQPVPDRLVLTPALRVAEDPGDSADLDDADLDRNLLMEVLGERAPEPEQTPHASPEDEPAAGPIPTWPVAGAAQRSDVEDDLAVETDAQDNLATNDEISAPEPVPEDVAQSEAQETEPYTSPQTLSEKIAALEEVVSRRSDQWEPDDPGVDAYAGTDEGQMEWVDAATPEDKAAAEPTNTEEPIDAELFAADEAVLDEDALRDLVADIVREELQGALGERITRNVRKLVRREIHRALAAQDLD